MKKNAVGFLLVAGCVVLMANGCAKHELVKKDESIAPAVNTTAKPIEKKEAKEMAVKPVPVQETTLNENAKQTLDKEQLQAALEKIYFGFDSYELSDAARTSLAKNSGLLKKNSAIKI